MDNWNLSQPTVSKKLLGKVGWSIEEILKIAEFLNVPVEALLPAKGDNGGWIPTPYGSKWIDRMEPTNGLEPLTCCLQDSCSTS